MIEERSGFQLPVSGRLCFIDCISAFANPVFATLEHWAIDWQTAPVARSGWLNINPPCFSIGMDQAAYAAPVQQGTRAG